MGHDYLEGSTFRGSSPSYCTLNFPAITYAYSSLAYDHGNLLGSQFQNVQLLDLPATNSSRLNAVNFCRDMTMKVRITRACASVSLEEWEAA